MRDLNSGPLPLGTRNENSFHYEDRTVAFIDVLGFSELVIASEKNLLARGKIAKLVEVDDLFDRFMKVLSFADATFFSDSFIISMPRSDAIFFMVREIGYLCRHLLLLGLPCRGAITVGPIYHKGSVVIGPALMRAYGLEQSVAVYPRVILDNVAMENWRSEFALKPAHSHCECLIKSDASGQPFIDIFNQEFARNFLPWTDVEPSSDVVPVDAADFIRGARKQIQASLVAYRSNPKISAKYEWLASECDAADTRR